MIEIVENRKKKKWKNILKGEKRQMLRPVDERNIKPSWDIDTKHD